jgi:hypothetical protein
MLFFSCGLIGAVITVAFWSFTGIRNIDIDNLNTLEEINGKLEKVIA